MFIVTEYAALTIARKYYVTVTFGWHDSSIEIIIQKQCWKHICTLNV